MYLESQGKHSDWREVREENINRLLQKIAGVEEVSFLFVSYTVLVSWLETRKENNRKERNNRPAVFSDVIRLSLWQEKLLLSQKKWQNEGTILKSPFYSNTVVLLSHSGCNSSNSNDCISDRSREESNQSNEWSWQLKIPGCFWVSKLIIIFARIFGIMREKADEKRVTRVPFNLPAPCALYSDGCIQYCSIYFKERDIQ